MDRATARDGTDRIRATIEQAMEVVDPLEALIEATKTDPGAPFTPEALKALAELKADDLAAFETLRAKLKGTDCRIGALDKALAQQSEGNGAGRGPTQADLLLQLGDDAALFHTEDGTAYADIAVADHRETWPIRDKGFRSWLTKRFYEETGGAPNREALQSALDVLAARARFDGPERTVFVRVGEHEDKIYLDLADPIWRAVEVDAAGWRVVDTPPVRFRRTNGMKPLPAPERGGSIESLRRFLNVQSDGDFVLVIAWALACLRPKGPYPLLVLSGEQGSAKSTFSAILRALLDPRSAALRALPREDRDLFITATSTHLLAFDNLSGLSPWISDTLCRLATGGGFAVRALYSDQEEVLFETMRPVILNGIEDVVTRADLADRAVVLQLAAISEEQRRSEAEIWADFEMMRPQLLGALLEGVVKGLRRLADTHLARLPRMADFALWASACETAFWPEGTFWAAYEGNRQEAVESVIEADPVAAAVRALMTERTVWVGTATELLAELAQITGERIAKAKTWPGSSRALADRLRRAATFLRKTNIEIVSEKERSRKRSRLIRITAGPLSSGADNAGMPSSAPSVASAPERKLNGSSSLARADLRTIERDADASADDRSVRQASIVRSNSLNLLPLDAADATDAGAATQSEQEDKAVPTSWSMRL